MLPDKRKKQSNETNKNQKRKKFDQQSDTSENMSDKMSPREKTPKKSHISISRLLISGADAQDVGGSAGKQGMGGGAGMEAGVGDSAGKQGMGGGAGVEAGEQGMGGGAGMEGGSGYEVWHCSFYYMQYISCRFMTYI